MIFQSMLAQGSHGFIFLRVQALWSRVMRGMSATGKPHGTEDPRSLSAATERRLGSEAPAIRSSSLEQLAK